MSFFTSLSGLQAAQTDMSTISHNLANVSTNGFKKSRAEFADVIASSVSISPNSMIGSGAVTKQIQQQFGQGSFTQSASALDLAIAGDGFFAVKPEVAGSKVNFTRNGSFQVNSDRYVVDGQGGHLQAYPVDGSGAVVASGIDQAISLRLPQSSGTPVPTSKVNLAVNLNGGSVVPPGTFDRFDPSSYNQSTQTTIYDASGNAVTMTSYFVRETKAGVDGAVSNDWSVHNFVGDTALVADPANPGPVTLSFDENGAMTAPTGPVSYAPFTPSGSTSEQTISFGFDPATTTQLGRPFAVTARTQDGVAVGQLQGVTVDADGIVRASFSNGESQALGKVALANFSNPAGLRQMGNSYWAASGLSGEAVLGEAGGNGFGSLMTGMTEGSNVDITEELVGLIAAQRNFQANAKALDTASQISQSILNIRA